MDAGELRSRKRKEIVANPRASASRIPTDARSKPFPKDSTGPTSEVGDRTSEISHSTLKLTRCPRSFAPTLAALPSTSLAPLAPFYFLISNF
jgi:hypothetical protein